MAQGPPRAEVRRAVSALQPATLLRGKQRAAWLHQLHRVVYRQRVRRLSAGSGRQQGPGRRRSERSLDAPAESLLGLRAGRFQDDPESDPEPGLALGLHVTTRGERQPAVELRPGHRRTRSLRRMAASRSARSTSPTTKASSHVSAQRGESASSSCFVAPTASRSSWKGPAQTYGFR